MNKMLKQILNTIINEISYAAEMKTGRYKGEFEDGADWNPQFPCALVRVLKMTPEVTGMSNSRLGYVTKMVIYIGDRETNESKTLDTVEYLIGLFDSAEFETEDGKYFHTAIGEEGFSFHGYGSQVEVYTLTIDVRY